MVVPILLLGTKYHQQLDEVLEGMADGKQLLKKHLMHILTFILPFYSLKKSQCLSDAQAVKNVKKAVSAYEYLIMIFTLKVCLWF